VERQRLRFFTEPGRSSTITSTSRSVLRNAFEGRAILKLVSVNVGVPRSVEYCGRRVTTGIFKQPVTGRVWVGRENLAGDVQADRRVHGGSDKAVYAYPVEHYAYWGEELGRAGFGYGQFGENFTVEGLLEEAVCIGDTFRVGEALVQVSQPRTPCFKLDLKMGIEKFRERFRKSLRTGFYLSVLEEGLVMAGDVIESVERAPNRMSVRDIFTLRHIEGADQTSLAAASKLPGLSASWRAAFEKRMAQ
jgi:MOSC domain-containing protein YiiM